MTGPPITIRLSAPVVDGQSVRFAWEATPKTDFYRRESFTIEFPPAVDPSAAGPDVWLRVMMVCLHQHWALLRPCRVIVPYALPPGEAEFWMRLTDAAIWTLEGNLSDAGDDFAARTARGVEIVCAGPPIEPPARVEDRGIAAAAFSGGRDSLTQTALLDELGERLLLVTVTSTRADSHEFHTARRRTVMEQIVERRDVELAEVLTDVREAVVNDHQLATRHGVSGTELGDTHVYFAATWAVGAIRGAHAVYLASEAEVQESIRRDGMVVQHKHFMYSAATQRALAALIAPTGMTHCGLTYGLLQFQVQRILGTRYPDLRDLQYSCWEQRAGEDVCSRCRECFTNAVNLMSDRVDPAEIGMDIEQLLIAQAGWKPGGAEGRPRGVVGARSGTYGDDQTLRFLRDHDFGAIAALSGLPATPQTRAAVERLRATALAAPDPGPEPGFRAGYLELIDPRLRDGLGAIAREHFPDEPLESYAHLLENSRALGDWVGAPLNAGKAAAPTTQAAPSRPVRPRPPARIEPSPDELAELAPLIPAPEPELAAANGHRRLPVADTDLGGDELRLVTEAIGTNWVSSAGPHIERFEAEFAEYCGTRHAVTTASGATALELLLRASGIGPGDEVIIPSFTMVATANAVHHTGARPVFVDSDLATWNMDLEQVVDLIGPRTRAIMAMHTYGHPVDMDALAEIAERNALALFEDAAEAHGAKVRGRRVGACSDAAAFSLYGNKIITSGEGGIVTTDDDAIAEAARELRSHAFSPDRHFWHRRRAFNFRMSNLQAAVGLAQLARIEEFLERRRRLAALYREHLGPIPGISLAPLDPELEDANWMFGILLDDEFPCSRDELRELLAAQSIETRTFFIPLHIQPAYLDGGAGRRLPGAETLGRQGLYLPSALWLERSDVERIAGVVAQAAGAVASSPSSA